VGIEIPLKDAEKLIKICLSGIIDKLDTIFLLADICLKLIVISCKKWSGLVIAEINFRQKLRIENLNGWGRRSQGKPQYINSNLI